MKKGIGFSILIAALILGPPAAPTRPRPAGADNPAWKSIGPDGGGLRDLAVNPANANDLMAVFDSTPAQVYRSANEGKTWKRIGLFNDPITDLAFGPPGSGGLYAMSWLSLFKSRNGGSSWTQLTNPRGFTSFERLAAHPSDPDSLFILGQITSETASVGLARTTDGGQTWTSKRISPGADLAESHSLCVNFGNPAVIYVSGIYRTATTAKFFVYRTTNGGDSWQDITGGLSTQIYDLATDPNNPSRVFAATEGGVYRSSDSGQTWQSSANTSCAYGLAIDPANSSVLYAGYQKRVYKSTDGGIDWTSAETGLLGDCRRMAVAGSSVFFGSDAGVYRSTDAGATWAASQTGVRACRVPSFYVPASYPNVLYANVSNCGFYRSDSFGRTWSLLPYFYSCDDQGYIAAVDPGNPRTVYMIAPGQG